MHKKPPTQWPWKTSDQRQRTKPKHSVLEELLTLISAATSRRLADNVKAQSDTRITVFVCLPTVTAGVMRKEHGSSLFGARFCFTTHAKHFLPPNANSSHITPSLESGLVLLQASHQSSKAKPRYADQAHLVQHSAKFRRGQRPIGELF